MANDQVQFFTGVPEYNQQFQISNVNAITHMIANCKQVKIPTYNIGHRGNFWQNTNDNGDKFLRGFEKRDGVNTAHTEQEIFDVTGFDNAYITHRIELDGAAYYYVIDGDGQDMCIVAECGGAYRHDDCSLRIETVKNTVLRKITNNRPYNECVHTRMIKSRGPKKKKGVGCSGIISRVKIGNSYIYVFHGKNIGYQAQGPIGCFDSVKIGDVLYIKGNASSGLAGFFRPISGFYKDEAAGIYDGIQLDGDASLGDITQEVTVELYETVGNTISFATADGVWQLHENGCDGPTQSETKYEMTGGTIDALFTFNGRMGYIADNIYHISEGGYNYGTFIATNNIPLIDQYRDGVQVGNLLYLLGPSSMGIVADYIFKDAVGATSTLQRMYDVPESDGYFNKFSYDVKNGDFYMVTREGRRGGVTIAAAQSSQGSPIINFSYKFLDLGKRHINTDLAMLNRIRGDRVIVSSDERRVYISILNGKPTTIDNFKTHILVYEFEDKYRHHRYFCHHYIEQYRNGAWIGPRVYYMEGRTDDGKGIKQIISYQFGDISPFSLKNIIKLYQLYGGKSRIGKDTEMVVQYELHGKMLSKRMVNLNSIEYFNEIKARGTQQGAPIKHLGQRQKLFSGNGFSDRDFILPTVLTDIESYCSYENNKPFEKVDRCEKNITKLFDGCKDLRTDEPINDNDPRERTYFYNSKTSIHGFEVGELVNLMSVQIIADGEDNIEWFGYNIAYHFGDMSILSEGLMYTFPE